MKFFRRAIVPVIIAALLTACTAPASPAETVSIAPDPPSAESSSQPEQPSDLESPAAPLLEEPEPPQPPFQVQRGMGNLSYDLEDGEGLTEEQEALLLGYLDRYHESMARLTVFDPAPLFETEAQAASMVAVWKYEVGMRQTQEADFSVNAYSYELTVMDIQERGGALHVICSEDSIQNFAATPDTDSQRFDVYHRFSLKETEEGWRLTGHMQMDSLYWRVMGRGGSSQVDGLLAQGKEQMGLRQTEGTLESPSADVPYDAQAAVAYAYQWADDRNPQWRDYSRNGGNCQNYVSQCLLAGGIPMDPYGPQVWKWYGDTPNNLSGTSGRSGSWSAVEQFVEYARNNTGYGLAAQADAPYYSGVPGDVIAMGSAEEEWRHIVIITDTITDKEGKTVGYLVDSNTAGLKDYPVGFYHYTRQSLIKIWGWNR